MFQGEKFFSVLLFVGFFGVIAYVINLNASAVSEEGLETLHKEHQNDRNYTVLLSDMDFHDDKYWHKYKMLIEKSEGSSDSSGPIFDSVQTDWMSFLLPFSGSIREHWEWRFPGV